MQNSLLADIIAHIRLPAARKIFNPAVYVLPDHACPLLAPTARLTNNGPCFIVWPSQSKFLSKKIYAQIYTL